MSNLSNRHTSAFIYGKYVEARMAGRGESFRLTMSTMSKVENLIAGLSDIDKNKAVRAGLGSAGRYLSRKGKERLAQRTYKAKVGKSGRVSRSARESLAARSLFNSFVVRVKKQRLGTLVGFNKRGSHAHLVDLGTRKRKHPITGTSGVMPRNEFWSDTAKEDWNGAVNILYDAVRRSMTRIMMGNNY